MSKSKFLYGAIILAVINFIVRIIGFLYKILLSRLIGPQGIGLFQIVMPILMVFITITTSGLPIAISKLVAKESSTKNYDAVKKTFRITVFTTFILSIFLSILLLTFSKQISYNLLDNPDSYYLILFLAPAIIIISLSSVIRGYLYGLKKISTAGVAQIIEQLTRIIFVLGLLYYLGPIESKIGAFVAVCGISLGEVFGLIWLIFSTNFINKRLQGTNHKKVAFIKIISQITYISVPITISRIINVSLQLANAVMIPQRLAYSGYSSIDAISTYGRVIGMAIPLIFLPFIVTTALVINIIPNLSEQISLKRYDLIKRDISLALKITVLIAFPVTFMYIFYSNKIALLIYKDVIVGKYLGYLGFTTVFISMYHTLSGILQGIGKQIRSTINFIIGMSFQLVITYNLVGNPNYRINGFFIGFFTGAVIICTLNYITLIKAIKIQFKVKELFIKPIISSVIMITSIYFTYNINIKIIKNDLLTVLISLPIGVLSYIISLFIFKSLPFSVISIIKNRLVSKIRN